MWRKVFCLVVAAVVLGLAGAASAEDFVWNNDWLANSSWCEADNWDRDEVPIGSSDTAIIDETSPDRGPIVGIGCDVDVGTITGPNPAFGNTQVMDINTSGTVDVGVWDWRDGKGTATININGIPTITIESSSNDWRAPDDGTGILNISGDPNIVCIVDLRGADGAGGFLYINMSGGRLECQDDLVWGDNGGGELNLSGGSLIVGDNLDLGGYRGAAPITINMTDGSISVGGKLLAPGSAKRAGVVRINLYGGVIDCDEFVHGGSDGGEDETPSDPTFTDDWRLDIEQGTLKIKGDRKAAIDANVANDQITAYDGEGRVVVVYDDVNGRTVVTGLPPDPNTATNPIPPNRSEGQDPNVDLGWTSGINAAQHKIFFGTSFEDVNGMTDPCDTKPLGQETYEPNTLEIETTYYWRIDEVNGPQTWRGRVWRFTTKSPIDDPNLLLHYKLDEPNGHVAHDSSGHGNHGVVDGNELGWDPNDAHPHDPPAGGSRNFTDIDEGEDKPKTVIDCVNFTVLNAIDDSITVSVWLKDAYNSDDDDNWVFHSGAGGEAGPYQVGAVVVTKNISPAGQALWRAGNDSNDLLMWDLDGRNPETLKDWHLWCFVKDENVDEMRIYFDGLMVKDRSGTFDTLVEVHDVAFKIGAASFSDNYDYMGRMDDFRLYDYALSDKQIEELYRGGDVGYPWAPSPGDYAEDVPRDANLSWRPGNYAASHKVYFGTDWDDVNDMSDPCATPGVGNEVYDPGVLDLGSTYFWRVDEVNGPNTWKGPVWRFTVADFIMLDDFESYGKSQNQIYYTWYCKQAMPYGRRSGAILTLSYDPVHIGEQAMKYEYETDNTEIWDQDYAYADACLPLDEIDGLQDWTTVDVRLLTIFFYGQADNDANETEQMYLGVHDSSMRYAEMRYGDNAGEAMSNLKVEEWQKWDVPFVWYTDSNFAAVSAEIDFSAISSVYLGFGDRFDPVPAGNGVAYFDDLRISMPICRGEYGPIGDLNGDCVVGVGDVGAMGDQWLRHDINVNPVTEPPTDDPNLVAHWKLDGNTTDSSTSGYHGTAEGAYAWTTGKDGQAIDLSGGWVVVEDEGNTPKLRPKHYVSVMAWIYLEGAPEGSRVVIKGRNDVETFGLEVSSDDGAVFIFRDANDSEDVLSVNCGHELWAHEWIHLAGTYDNNDQLVYVNGVEEGSKTRGSIELIADVNDGLGIGGRYGDTGNRFDGKIDDVRVYDRAVTRAEIAYIAGGPTGLIPLEAEANLYSGEEFEVINFKDFAKLFEYWGDEQLWPPEPAP